MTVLRKMPSLTVEEFQRIQEKMFAIELMQMLIARSRAALRDAIVTEQEEHRPNAARIEALERESLRLHDLDPETAEEIRAVVEEMKTYTVPLTVPNRVDKIARVR